MVFILMVAPATKVPPLWKLRVPTTLRAVHVVLDLRDEFVGPLPTYVAGATYVFGSDRVSGAMGTPKELWHHRSSTTKEWSSSMIATPLERMATKESY